MANTVAKLSLFFNLLVTKVVFIIRISQIKSASAQWEDWNYFCRGITKKDGFSLTLFLLFFALQHVGHTSIAGGLFFFFLICQALTTLSWRFHPYISYTDSSSAPEMSSSGPRAGQHAALCPGTVYVKCVHEWVQSQLYFYNKVAGAESVLNLAREKRHPTL